MHPQIGNGADGTSIHQIVEDLLGERIEALASWIQELDAQVRATSAAGDEKTLKELRKALEAWTKRDPKFEERLTERVDVLADRLATLSSTVNTTAAARASSEGELASLRRELEQETAKLHAALQKRAATDASKELQELRRAVADLGRAPRGRDEAGAGSREDIENLAVRIDMLAKTVATTAAGLAGREGDLASLRRALDDANARIEQVAASLPKTTDASHVARLESRVAELAKAVDDTARAVAERERLATSVQGSVEQQGARLQELAGAVSESTRALEARLAEVADRQDDSGALAELDARVAALTDRLGAADARLAEIRGHLESLSTQLGALASEGAGGAEEIAGLRRQVEESGERFESSVAELRALIDGLPTEPAFTELETRLAPIQSQVDGLAARLDESRGRLDRQLAEVRHQLETLRAQPSHAELETRLAPLEAQVGGLAARIVEADGRMSERLERETSRSAEVARQLGDVHARLEEVARAQETTAAAIEEARSGAELERAWVREQMDALVSTVADTASRADVEPLLESLGRRVEEISADQSALTAEIARTRESVLAETERLDGELRALPAPSPAQPDLEPVVDDLARRVEALAGQQSARSLELASAQEALRSHVERLETALEELPEPTAAPDLEPLLGDLTRRVEALASEQSSRAAEIATAHATLRAAVERVESQLLELPEPLPPVPPSEDAQLRELLTAFADRIDAMEQERAGIAEEAAEAALATVGQVRPLVEGLRRRLDESERRLEALGPTDELNARLEELATRVQAVEERPSSPPQPAPLPGDGRFRVELRALELRMQHAEAAARENREAVLVQLERLASRIEWRLQRLENSEPAEPEGSQEEPSLGQVVPLRGGAETT